MLTLNEAVFAKWLKLYKEKRCLRTCREVDSHMLDAFVHGIEVGKEQVAKEQAMVDMLTEIKADRV